MKRVQFLDRAEEMKLARRALRGDIAARNAVVENLMPLIFHLAQRMARLHGGEVNDLASVALTRIVAMFHNFKPRKKVRPISYFGFIAGRIMKEYATRINLPIALPRKTREHFQDDRERAYRVCSLADPIGGQGTTEIGATLADPRTVPPEAEAIRAEEIAQLRAAVALLPDRWRQVIEGRLAGQTLETLSRELNLSRERIRQVESAAQRKLAELMGGP